MSRIEKFLLSLPPIPTWNINERKISSTFVLFDNAWQQMIYRKFHIYLTPEQKWHLLLALCIKLRVDVEKELPELSNEAARQIALAWYLDNVLEDFANNADLDVIKTKNLHVPALVSYIIENPSLHRGERIVEMQRLVNSWYSARTIVELKAVRFKIGEFGAN